MAKVRWERARSSLLIISGLVKAEQTIAAELSTATTSTRHNLIHMMVRTGLENAEDLELGRQQAWSS